MIAILHNIRSLHNVGSIFRTADAAGVTKLYLTGITPSPLDEFGKPRPQLTKVALGAEKYVLWEKRARITALITALKKDGYSIIALEQSPDAIPYNQLRKLRFHKEKVALIVGNEVRGLSAAVLRQCDTSIEIPMRGKKESLNVAVAFGIVVFGIH